MGRDMRDETTGSAPSDVARLVIESIALPLVVIDRGSRIVTANQAFATLCGAAAAELDRRLLPDLAARLWGLDQPLRSLLAAPRDFQLQHRTKDANPRVLSFRGYLLRPENRFLLVAVEDVTAGEGRRELVASLLRSQEEERRGLARELHDDISQRLARLEMDADAFERSLSADPQANRRQIAELRHSIASVSTVIRAISHRLYPSIIEDLGLGPALRSLVDNFRDREQMSATYFDENVPEDVPQETATLLYRLVEDALRTVAEQAETISVQVTLQGGREGLRLEILARGFEAASVGAGIALIAMEERARVAGASFRIESAAGEGARISVDLPALSGA
jgi:signal transduction histidine kinase